MSERRHDPKAAPVGSVAAPELSVAQPPTTLDTASLLALIDRLGSLLERSDVVELEVESGETGIVLRKPAALAPVAATMSTGNTSLLVLAIGSGSLFFSHVNDAGFWLVKEYFGLSVGETIRSWSVMETVISVSGLLLVLSLSLVV